MVVSILALHVAGGWALMQVDAVRDAVLDSAPMFVRMIQPETPPAEPVPAPPPPPPLQQPRRIQPLPPPIVTAAPSPAPAPSFTVPAPPPLPAPPAPPAPVAAIAAPAAVPAPAPAPQVIPSSAVQYLEPPVPVYPRLSARSREAGRVLLRAYIGADGGAPREVAVDQSSGFARLDQAGLAAVQKARFKPYSENGRPVEGWALIPIVFELEK